MHALWIGILFASLPHCVCADDIATVENEFESKTRESKVTPVAPASRCAVAKVFYSGDKAGCEWFQEIAT